MNLEKITVKEISAVMTKTFAKGMSVNISSRDGFGLLFCKEGKITCSYEGKTCAINPNHIVFLPKTESCIMRVDETGVFVLINFLCDEIVCDTIVSVPIKNVEPYLADFKKFEMFFQIKEKRLEIMSVFYKMMQRISAEMSNSYGILQSALKHLEENLFRVDLSIAELAGQCNMSEVYFRKLFLAQTGTSPKQYILDARIERAKQLLSDGVLKVGAVADKCGFANQYNFSRVFRKKTGLTPTEYRKQSRLFET